MTVRIKDREGGALRRLAAPERPPFRKPRAPIPGGSPGRESLSCLGLDPAHEV